MRLLTKNAITILRAFVLTDETHTKNANPTRHLIAHARTARALAHTEKNNT